MPKEPSMYFSPRCLFCDKNNGRRHTRRGRTWQCKHCGEMNPGPGMLKAIVGRFTTPPADAKHTNGTTQPAPAKAAATMIKGVAKAPAAKREKPEKPARSAVVSKAQPKPSAPSTPPPPAKKGVLEQIAARVYG